MCEWKENSVTIGPIKNRPSFCLWYPQRKIISPGSFVTIINASNGRMNYVSAKNVHNERKSLAYNYTSVINSNTGHTVSINFISHTWFKSCVILCVCFNCAWIHFPSSLLCSEGFSVVHLLFQSRNDSLQCICQLTAFEISKVFLADAVARFHVGSIDRMLSSHF